MTDGVLNFAFQLETAGKQRDSAFHSTLHDYVFHIH